MTNLTVLCAGAAQSVVSELAAAVEREGPYRITAHYGAVHALKSRIVAGEPADAFVLTDTLVDELIALGLAVQGSRADLGSVPTGIAVRRDQPIPDVSDARRLRVALLHADRIVCPDPALASAGRALVDVLSRLDIADQLSARLAYTASGAAAMTELSSSRAERGLGVAQLSEIRAHGGVVLAGIFPADLQHSPVVYAAGLAAGTTQPQLAAAFIRRLAGAEAALRAAGFGSMHRSA